MRKIRKYLINVGLIAGVLLSLVSGSVLLYQWWKNQQVNKQIAILEQQLDQAEQNQAKNFQAYQIQKDWVNLTAPWANNPQVKELFHVFLNAFASRYAKSKGLNNSHLPLLFGGFYQKALTQGEKQGEMGNCGYDKQNKLVVIEFNQLYLLNKLGYERYFASPERFLVIDLPALTETMAHEIAHYLQFVKYEKSSCESSGAKDSHGKFLYPNLVVEHAQFTKEIKEIIINSAEYKKFAEWWRNPEV